MRLFSCINFLSKSFFTSRFFLRADFLMYGQSCMSIGLVRLVFCQSVYDFQKFIRRGGYTHFEIAANHGT